MYECQEVSNTALHNFPPTTGLKSKEMRTKIKEKSLTPAGFEPTTSGLEPRFHPLPGSSRTLKQSD